MPNLAPSKKVQDVICVLGHDCSGQLLRWSDSDIP